MIDKYGKYLILLEGFVVLSLQILVSVIITPFFGNNFTFWVWSMFFTMFGLSIGYLLASRFKKRNSKSFISSLLFYVFVYLGLVLLISDPLLYSLIDFTGNYHIDLASGFILLLFIPIVFLATVPVLIVQLRHETADEGASSGDAFSLSSFAGIAGVFLITFLLLPNLGVKLTTLIVLSAYAILLYLFNVKADIKKQNVKLVVVFVCFGIFYLGQDFSSKKNIDQVTGNIKVKTIRQGVHSELKVVDDYTRTSRFLYVNNVPQTKAHFTGRSLYSYLYSLSIYTSVKPKYSKVLLAGLGGGNLVYELAEMQYKIDVVDIDERLPGIIEDYFLKSQKTSYNYIKSDIRKYFKTSPKKYDVIILDLSYGENVPTNVFTKESFAEAKKMLNPGGIILVHFLSSLSMEGYTALASIGRTLKACGYDYRLMNRMNQKDLYDQVTDPESPSAYIFMASPDKINLENAAFTVDPDIPKEIIPQKGNLYLKLDDSKGMVLTDDKPILDVLQNKNVINIRKQNIQDLLINRK